ncbi:MULTISPECIES: ATP-dependent DNA ligase LigA [unclassified Haladaptatus]|uniref:ATP-dependent DNA ligase LigA n=1 Tax=unclassified Haladaptatus TaxID=2622732 RepID=UPI00209BFB08|nr:MULTISPECIES: ATP-dependent DNA ligase LigA [unclassified Haladaptatus]MCO8244115.1 ATP-dependent DNA ligase [Haladaptatus sp. AB643]MCO8255920.1 ATP-dependent DNA ligase [Haladaptatus sp. AB618]
MEFAAFAEVAGEIEELSADTDIIDAVTDLLSSANDDLDMLARFVQGRVFPAWDSTTLDIGPNLCYTAIARAAGQNVSADDVEDRLAELGDIGAVAASYDFGGQRGLAAFGAGQDELTVAEVANELDALATTEGSGSQDTKIDILFGLFNRTDSDEARYLARLVLSEMRIGVGQGTVRDAIAAAFDVPVESVQRALQVSNDYGRVARVARDEGESGLDELQLEVGRPVQAMLAQAGTVTDALEDWERAGVEWKFDGARVQLHYDGEEVRIFSRNMEEVTNPLPEIVEYAEENLTAPAIVDGEVVAMADGEPLPFQEVLRRFRRKHDVARAREEVAVELRAFDCLHADGEDLLTAPLTERHDRLQVILSGGVSSLTVTGDEDEIVAIEENALDAGHEGIMLKNPDSTYSPGRRGKNWRKRKPDVETVDLVVTGAEWGEGRRASFLGTFLLSARTENDEFETLGKVATGITDEELAELTELLEPHIATQDGQVVDLSPEVVFEVGYEEIQQSPTYSSGFALRFPRFLGVRDDKTPESADSLERIERLAEMQ